MECKNGSCLRLSAFQPEVDLLDLNEEIIPSSNLPTPPINQHKCNFISDPQRQNSLHSQHTLSQSFIDVNGNMSSGNDCCDFRRLSSARSLQSLRLFGSIQNNGPTQLGNGMTLSDKLALVYQQAQSVITGDQQQQQQLVAGIEKSNINNMINNRDAPATISHIFYKFEMHELHPLNGEEEIDQVLKFLVKSAPTPKGSPLTATEAKRLHHLRSALFKECGFSVKASVLPIMSFKQKNKLFRKAPRRHFIPNSQELKLLILLCVRNRQRNQVYIDCHGRVYQNIKDWEKNNTLPPSTLIIPVINQISKYDSPEAPFSLKIVPSPSSTTAKRALDACDITMGIGALTAGVACLSMLTGGAALPFLLAGELVATAYMSIRATTSIVTAKKHRPKSRR